MPDIQQPDPDERRLDAFLRQYWDDRERGILKSLKEYLQLFPDIEVELAQAYVALARGFGEGEGVAPDDAEKGSAWIGPYRIRSILGRGGQATVYRADDVRLRRLVALKVLEHLGGNAIEGLQRFRREAEIASKLDHPAICSVYDTGVVGTSWYIAMRLIDGETLSAKIAREARGATEHETLVLSTAARLRPPPPVASRGESPSEPRTSERNNVLWALKTIEVVARALHVAHEAGVVHRDIKPGNIMVTPAGDPIVLDFGLAQMIDPDADVLTHSGQLFGTPAYMSPEQLLAGRVVLDRRTDVWSLGVTLYEMLTLRRPFAAPSREGLILAIQSSEPENPQKLNRAISSDLRVVLETALAKNRDRRYQTALDFAEDLRRVRGHEPIRARRAGPWVRVLRWTQRNPAIATAVMLVAIFVSIGSVLITSVLRKADLEHARAESMEPFRAIARDIIACRALVDDATTDRLSTPTAAIVPELKAWLSTAKAVMGRTADHRRVLSEIGIAPFTVQSVLADFVRVQTETSFLGVGISSIEARLAVASRVQAITIDDRMDDWRRTTSAMASNPRYHDFSLKPQPGLVPLGPDPASGLVEFAELATGDPPARDANGSLRLTENSSLVFVLLPGGRFWMGSQNGAPDERNFEASAEKSERPVKEVDIGPVLISKFELTQGQWLRLTGTNDAIYRPGYNGPASFTLLHPIEHISWSAATAVLRRIGLALPTEAQWEYACRAGTTNSLGAGPGESLRSMSDPTNPDETQPSFRRHSPVGSHHANAFGIHDMLGNVCEWCVDVFDSYEKDTEPGTGRRLPSDPNAPTRAVRGGGFMFDPSWHRAGKRNKLDANAIQYTIGVRPIRPITQ